MEGAFFVAAGFPSETSEFEVSGVDVDCSISSVEVDTPSTCGVVVATSGVDVAWVVVATFTFELPAADELPTFGLE